MNYAAAVATNILTRSASWEPFERQNVWGGSPSWKCGRFFAGCATRVSTDLVDLKRCSPRLASEVLSVGSRARKQMRFADLLIRNGDLALWKFSIGSWNMDASGTKMFLTRPTVVSW